MKHVLFVCTHNAGRSQMAHAFFERHGPSDVRAESAGQEPASRIWPEVVEAMAEIGIDLSNRRPTRLTVEMQLHADWAITLACGATCPYVPTIVEDWDIPDPAGKSLEEVRSIRDDVEARVKDLIEQRLDAIRSDRTAHQVRLARLLPALADEFGGRREDKEIRACADAILSEYQEAPGAVLRADRRLQANAPVPHGRVLRRAGGLVDWRASGAVRPRAERLDQAAAERADVMVTAGWVTAAWLQGA